MYDWVTLIFYIDTIRTLFLLDLVLVTGSWMYQRLTEQRASSYLPFLIVLFGLLELGLGAIVYEVITVVDLHALRAESIFLAVTGSMSLLCLWGGSVLKQRRIAVWISLMWLILGLLMANQIAQLLDCPIC